jgi:DNA invertase Pin-like site-specific DNA recombinase
MADRLLVPAAQYLRMSTKHQQYSIENQSAAIEKYAASHGCEIVRTYSDAAKSGLVLRRRAGLRQLLRDVVAGTADYRIILVANRQVFLCITAPRRSRTTVACQTSS